MVTLEQIRKVLADHRMGAIFHEDGLCTRSIGPRGGVTEHVYQWRVNGALQTWKTDASRFRLPLKRGLREYSEIVPSNTHLWHIESDCPLLATDGEVAQYHPVKVK